VSTTRTMPGGRVPRDTLPTGENGHAQCRWCSLEVPPPKRTFCSAWCVHEWKLRTDPGYLRECVLKRDRAVCAVCQTDTREAWLRLKRARGERRAEMLAKWNLTKMNRRTLWDADHIVPVVEGGGECDLSNIRTLCLRCHREVTQALRERRRA